MDIVVYSKYKVKIKGKANVLVNRYFDEFEEQTWEDEKIITGGELMSIFAENTKDEYICGVRVIDEENIYFEFFNYNTGGGKDIWYNFTPIIEGEEE